MITKVIAGVLMAGSLLVSNTASAAWSWTGTLADWAASGGGTGVVIDGDGDAAFQLFNTTTIPDGTAGSDYITLSEIQIGSTGYYDVGVNWDSATGFANGYSGGGQLVYTMSVVGNSPERINSAALDSVITGTGTTALKNIYDLPSNTLFLNLSSFDGARDPITGYAQFSGRSIIGVQDIYQPSETGVFQDVHNSYTMAVAEPASMALFGLGMASLFMIRRKRYLPY